MSWKLAFFPPGDFKLWLKLFVFHKFLCLCLPPSVNSGIFKYEMLCLYKTVRKVNPTFLLDRNRHGIILKITYSRRIWILKNFLAHLRLNYLLLDFFCIFHLLILHRMMSTSFCTMNSKCALKFSFCLGPSQCWDQGNKHILVLFNVDSELNNGWAIMVSPLSVLMFQQSQHRQYVAGPNQQKPSVKPIALLLGLLE